MNLYHFSEKEIVRLQSRDEMVEKEARIVEDLPEGDERRQQFQAFLDRDVPFGSSFKPKMSFWFSDENANQTWSDWCDGEQFRPERMRYRYPVHLNNEDDWLIIPDVLQLDRFTDEYMDKTKWLAECKRYGYHMAVDNIDWDRVAGKYCGVIITPYQWSRRLEGLSSGWYYPWDCASGFAFDPVQSITLGEAES